MSVSVIGTVGVPACYGGFESLVENIVASEEFSLVYCSAKAYQEKVSEYKGAKLKYIKLDANGVQSIPYDILSILHTLLFTKNKLLLLGVSGAVVLPFVRLFSSRRIVTNIDGLEWKRDKWGTWAKRFLKFSEKMAVKYSDVIIADNQAIADYVQEEYSVSSEVIAYGGDHAVVDKLTGTRDDFALALCRIEPENNVHLVLEAFSKSKQQLKFIGNWDRSDYGRQLKEQYAVFDNIEIIDPIYQLDKLFELRSKCSLYVHGHSAGGTNPSLVEMMFFNVPIMCFDCSYNRMSTEDKAYYFKDAEQLGALLDLPNDDSLESAASMVEIANRRYTWKHVKSQYTDLFKE